MALRHFLKPPPPILADARLIPNTQSIPGVHPKPWQARAWNHYDSVGEVRFGLDWVANVLGRVRLFAAEQKDPRALPEESSDVHAGIELDRLRSSDGSHTDLIRRLALNLAVPGECYLAGHATDDDPDTWSIFSTEELRKQGTQWFLYDQGGALTPLQGADVVVHRLWTSHPRFSQQADSSMLPVGDLLDELLLIDQMYRSNARSRMSAGVLLVDERAAAPTTQVPDPFVQAIVHALTAPISDEASVANVAPGVIKIKGTPSVTDSVQHLTFGHNYDPDTAKRYESVLSRVITALPIPKEVVTGLGDSSHWNAALITRDAFDSHLAPRMQAICALLTKAFLRPALGPGSNIMVWFDASACMSRPTTDVVLRAHEQGIVSGEAARRVLGFGPDDSPSPAETELQLQAPASSSTPAPGVISAESPR